MSGYLLAGFRSVVGTYDVIFLTEYTGEVIIHFFIILHNHDRFSAGVFLFVGQLFGDEFDCLFDSLVVFLYFFCRDVFGRAFVGCVGILRYVQGDDKVRTFVDLALYPYFSFMHVDERTGERKSQAESLAVVAFFDLVVALEYLFLNVFGNSSAAVLDGDLNHGFFLLFNQFGTQSDVSAGLCVFKCVREQIIKNPFQFGRREPDFLFGIFQTDDKVDFPFSGYDVEDMGEFLQKVHDISFTDADMHLFHFDFTECQ